MPYDEDLADRMRRIYSSRMDVVEKKMFGGLVFMVSGHMSCGIAREELMVRVGAEGYADALAEPFAREMDLSGRSMRGFVLVEPEGFDTEEQLRLWIERSLAFVESLEPK